MKKSCNILVENGRGRGNWSKISNKFSKDKRLGSHAKALYLKLRELERDKKHVTDELLSAELQVSEKTLRKAKKELIDADWITYTKSCKRDTKNGTFSPDSHYTVLFESPTAVKTQKEKMQELIDEMTEEKERFDLEVDFNADEIEKIMASTPSTLTINDYKNTDVISVEVACDLIKNDPTINLSSIKEFLTLLESKGEKITIEKLKLIVADWQGSGIGVVNKTNSL